MKDLEVIPETWEEAVRLQKLLLEKGDGHCVIVRLTPEQIFAISNKEPDEPTVELI